MQPSMHDRAGAILVEALQKSGAARRSYLDEACGDDRELRAEVDSLLTASDEKMTLLDEPERAAVVAQFAVDGADRLIGKRVGRFTVEQVIGSGGMGTVYQAMQDTPRRIVALKVIHRGVSSPSALRRFEIESQLLGQLHHPGIAQVYESGVHDDGFGGLPYFAMEYLKDAMPITGYAEQHQLSSRQRMGLFAEVCDAVHHGHQKSIIHRDLKPDNILVDTSGRAKVIDFGVARATDADIQATTLLTEAGNIIGTLAYMSPEQISGDGTQLDTRSDVYALGVVLYELLALRLPYDLRNRSIPEAGRIVREDSPGKLSQVNRTFRGDIETIVAKALDKEKDRRYPSAAELAADVRRYLRNDPILAHPPSATYQLQKFARRHKGLVAGVVFAFLALVIGTAVATQYAIKANRQAQIAREEAERASRRFEQVRELAHTFIFDFHDKIVHLPGSTPTRIFLVSTGIRYLDDLAEEASDQPDLLLELADGYAKMGDVQGRPNDANLGDLSGALESYHKSLEIRRTLSSHDPENLAFQRMLAINISSIGDVQAVMGDMDASLRSYQDYMDIVEPLYQKQPDHAGMQRMMTFGHNQMGKYYKANGRLDDALTSFQASLALREKLARSKPDDARSQREVTVGHCKIGDVNMSMNDFQSALDSFQRAHEVRLKRAASNPNNMYAQRDASFTYGRIGNALLAMNRTDEALTNYTESQKIRMALSRADPENTNAQKDVAVGLFRIAEVQQKTQQFALARDNVRDFIDISEKLVARDENNVNYRGFLAEGHMKLGDIYAQLGEMDAVITHYQSGIRMQKLLISMAPELPEYTRSYANYIELLARAQMEAGQQADAIENFRKGLTIREEYATSVHEDRRGARELATAYACLGDVLMVYSQESSDSQHDKLNGVQEARIYLEKAYDILIEQQKLGILDENGEQSLSELTDKIAAIDK